MHTCVLVGARGAAFTLTLATRGAAGMRPADTLTREDAATLEGGLVTVRFAYSLNAELFTRTPLRSRLRATELPPAALAGAASTATVHHSKT